VREFSRDKWSFALGGADRCPDWPTSCSRHRGALDGSGWIYAVQGGWLGDELVKVGRSGLWPGIRARHITRLWPVPMWGVLTDQYRWQEAPIKRKLASYRAFPTSDDLPREKLWESAEYYREIFRVGIAVVLGVMEEVTGIRPVLLHTGQPSENEWCIVG